MITERPWNESGPVVNVSWNDAMQCCKWLTKNHPDLQFTLPTEAQWEYACRAGTTTTWCSGNDEQRLTDYGWVSRSWIHEVGTRLPNAFGLYDMHGNVWEWCQDSAAFYSVAPRTDPVGPADIERRVYRSGNSLHGIRTGDGNHAYGRSAAREGTSPSKVMLDRGFRVAAALPDDVIQAKFPTESSAETDSSGESAK